MALTSQSAIATNTSDQFQGADTGLNTNIAAETLSTPVGTTFVEAEDTSQVDYTGTGWTQIWCDPCSGNYSMHSTQAGDKASLTFSGVSISIVFVTVYDAGIVDIAIDGQPYPSIDLMNNVAAATRDPKEFVIATDLAPGEHTIEVTVTGQKGFTFGWADSAIVGIDGFRFGDFSFGTLEGRVLDPDGDGIMDADVEISTGSSVYTVSTASDGVFNLSGLAAGNYTVTASSRPDYVSKSVGGLGVVEGSLTSGADVTLPEAETHVLFHHIYSPRANSPVIQRPGDFFQINVKESSAATNWSASIATPYNTIDLHLQGAVYDEFTSWTLTVQIPSNVPNGLYDLTVLSTLTDDTEVRAVEVVDSYQSSYYFVVLGDPQAATNEPGQTTLNQMVDEINLIHPSFVLVVGDLIENLTAPEYEAFLQVINRLNVPTFSIPGNHDIGPYGALDYQLLWKQYVGKRFFSFDYGDHRYVGMDNSMLRTMDPDKIDIGGYMADQVAWAQADLLAHQDNPMRFMFLHVTNNFDYAVGDTPVEWKPGWIDDLGVSMVLSGHGGLDYVAVDGATPVHWVETSDSIDGRYRLVRIENDAVETYTYDGSAFAGIPYGFLNLSYSPANDGTSSTVTATIDNQLQETFEYAQLQFVMPGGSTYKTDEGTIVQAVQSDDGLTTLLTVSVDVPANSSLAVTVSEDNQLPQVVINSPAEGASFLPGETINFSGTASDAEDGSLTASLSWSSDLDGVIGSGGSFSLSNLTVGVHTITASVTDSDGADGSAQVSITVDNTAPSVSITSPANNDNFDFGNLISFSATASDAEDGDLTANLSWSSDLDGAIGSGGSFSKSNLTVGVHTITASVTDSDGADGSSQVNITVDNTAPSVSIFSPTNGTSYDFGDLISFSATASDAEDGDLTASLSWNSDLDGVIGSGGSFSLSNLTVGVHTITASVTDSDGADGSSQVSITVDNTAPSVSITSPTNGTSYDFGDSISFSATASDAEDGDLTANLSWSSDLDGVIGSGGSFSKSDLTVGVHTITASVTDSDGVDGSAQVSITVDNTAPSVSITSPADSTSYDYGDLILFSATASDAEDGDLTASLSWSSDLDGVIGSGGSFSKSDLTVGVHTITASVTDSDGADGSAQVSITVDNTAPTVSIISPNNSTSYDYGDSISFSATASDAEDGDLTASLSWSSDLDGAIGSGGSFSKSDLTVGIHSITASVTDSDGADGSAQVSITVDNTAPSVSITSPGEGTSYNFGDSISFSATASDAEDGDLSASLSWSSDLDGALGTGGSFSHSNLSVGVHTITASVTDSDGAGGSAQVSITVDNTAPSVSITSPADSTSYDFGVLISFSATASDAEDGDLTASLSWNSDLDGVIGSGGSFSLSNLTVGTHIITASVTDSNGTDGSAQVSITVRNTAPSVSITSPADTDSFDFGDLIFFSGMASDAEDGDLTASFSWSSDLDGALGTGGSFSRSDLSVGTHIITASVTDSNGGGDSAQVSITVDNTAPSVSITSPSDSTSYDYGDLVSFSATASDVEDGDLTASLSWSSDLDGTLGSGGSFSKSDLSVGTHIITASVTDSDGAGGSDQVSFTVNNTAPSVSITSPANNDNFDFGDSISFSGSASDAEDGSLTASLNWSSDLDGALGTGGSFSRSDLSVGIHTITASVTDSNGGGDSAQVVIEVFGDHVPPAAVFLSPVQGSFIPWPRAFLMVDTSSSINDVVSVTFYAYVGGAWLELFEDTNDTDGWGYLWPTADLADQIVSIRAVVIDYLGNQNEIEMLDMLVSSSINFGNGYEWRGNGLNGELFGSIGICNLEFSWAFNEDALYSVQISTQIPEFNPIPPDAQ